MTDPCCCATPDRVLLETADGLLRVQPYSDRILRISLDPSGRFDPRPEALAVAEPETPSRWTVREADLPSKDAEPGEAARQEGGPRAVLLSSPRMTVRIGIGDGSLAFLEPDGRPILADPPGRARILEKTDLQVPVSARIRRRVVLDDGVDGPVAREETVAEDAAGLAGDDGPAYHTRVRLAPAPDEAWYGLGQHEEPWLDLRGRSQFLYQHNLKISLPVLVSSRGYGLLFDTGSAALFRDDGFGTWFWTDCDRYLDYYVIWGGSLDGVVAGLRHLTGKAAQLPRWTLGYIQSKEHYHTQEEILATARRFRAEGTPVDCLVQDWQSWKPLEWGQKSYDPDRYPDPSGMIDTLHAMGIKYMHSIWPVMRTGGPDHAEMAEAGCLYANDYTYNPFLPEARALYWEQTLRGVCSHGADALWCDCTEPFKWDWGFRDRPDPVENFHRTVQEFKKWMDPRSLQEYSLYHARGLYEGWRATDPSRRAAILIRSGYPGQQRYGTIAWSGDISARWDVLRAQIPNALNFCVCGLPYWTLDIGAFFTIDNPRFWCMDGRYPGGVADPDYCELYVRWFQFAAFLPMLRAHGTDTPREVWQFGERGTVWRDAIEDMIAFRMRLLPYLSSLMGSAWADDGTPLRALAFDFPEDRTALRLTDEFLLGPWLLVCPVTEPGAESRQVWLPSGADWFDVHSGKVHPGGRWIQARTPLDRIPLYVRQGALLPMAAQAGLRHTGEWDPSRMELHLYSGHSGSFSYWEDAGDGYGYEAGEWRRIRMEWREGSRTLRLALEGAGYPGEPPEREIRVVVHEPAGSSVSHLRLSGNERTAELRLP